jgi:hypothetical protein
MFYESGIFPIFAAETKNSNSSEGPIENGGELPPPPSDPPKA